MIVYFSATVVAWSVWCTAAYTMTEEELKCLALERSPVEHVYQRVVEQTAHSIPAYLHCTIPEGTGSTVAWIRSADQALLTVGTISFTEDNRMKTSKKDDNEYVLIIASPKVRDTGCYLCEINASPESLIFPVYLKVSQKVDLNRLTYGRESRLMANIEGDSMVLVCQFEMGDSSEANEVIWTRNGERLDLNDTHKYSLKTKRSAGGLVEQIVHIKRASSSDGGNYACSVKQGHNASQIISINDKDAAFLSSSASLNCTIFIAWLVVTYISMHS